MKKFVTLIVVLGMVSVASAGPVLTMNGGNIAFPTTITMTTVSDTIELDIEIDHGFVGGNIAIQLSNSQASLDATGVWFNPQYLWEIGPGTSFPVNWDFAPSELSGNDAQNFGMTVGNFSNHNEDIRTLMNGLILHLDEATPVTVQLVAVGQIDYDPSTDNIPEGTLLGQINIIPEPATLVLLGLGGLLLRRRK